MKIRPVFLVPLLALMVLTSPEQADELARADVLLCATIQATVCTPEDECEIGPPWAWNIPQFIEIDLAAKRLSTTRASGENRATPIRNVERQDGTIFLQGFEGGRAFSFAISEATGIASITVAADHLAVAAFGSCTPKTTPN